MGFKVNFKDNQEVFAEDINAIAADIDSAAEVSTVFSDDVIYGVDDLNAITKALVTKGISKGLTVSVSGSDVTINAGVAFFEDGKKICVDSDGVNLTRDEDVLNYVWFSNDLETGIVSAKCTTEEPAGDFVLLCRILPDGTVTKNKDVAMMKNPSFLPNYYENVRLSVNTGHLHDGEVTEFIIPAGHTRMIIKGYYYHAYVDLEAKTMSIGGKNGMRTGSMDAFPIGLSYETSIFLLSCENNTLTCRVSYAGFINSTSEILDIDFI